MSVSSCLCFAWVDPWLCLAICSSVIEKNSEPQIALDSHARALHDSTEAIGVCEWVNERHCEAVVPA